MQWTIVNPVALPSRSVRQAALPPPLRGATIGLLGNRKPNASTLLMDMGQRMKAQLGAREVHFFEKFNAGTPCDPELLARVAAQSHLVLTGSGD